MARASHQIKQDPLDTRATDAALMRRLALRDPGALDEIAREHWLPAVAYVDRLVGSRPAAEDIVQQAMLALWNRTGPWVPNASIRTFLYRVARNLALNERDWQRVRSDAHPTLRFLSVSPITPAEHLERTELRQAVEAAVDRLPARRREAFILARLHDLSYKEIGEIMGTSPQTVANQISAALTFLRQALAAFVEP